MDIGGLGGYMVERLCFALRCSSKFKLPFIGYDSRGKVTGRRTAQIPCIRVKHEKSNNMPLFESFLLRMTDKLRFEPVNESISAEQMEICNTVSQALLDMGGYAGSNKTLARAYQDLSGVSPATAKRHIMIASKYKFIRCEPTSTGSVKGYAYHALEN